MHTYLLTPAELESSCSYLFISQDLFSICSLVSFYLCSTVVHITMLDWQLSLPCFVRQRSLCTTRTRRTTVDDCTTGTLMRPPSRVLVTTDVTPAASFSMSTRTLMTFISSFHPSSTNSGESVVNNMLLIIIIIKRKF